VLIVSRPAPSAVPNNRVPSTERKLARQQSQRNYPGSRLSFLSGSAIKRIKVGVKALFADSSAKIRSANLSLHPPVKLASNEKEYRFALLVANPSLGALAGFLAFPVQVVGERRAAPDNPIRSPHRYAPACLPSA